MKGFNSTNSEVFSQKPEQLWDAISKENNLNDTHPFCKNNNTLAWSDVEHRDQIEYLNGMKLTRVFTKWLEGKGYDLWIGEESGPKSYVKWRIADHKQGSKLTITVYPHLLRKWPKLISFIPYYLYIDPKLKSYLSSVVRGFKWYLDNGSSVPKNKFGKHSWFS